MFGLKASFSLLALVLQNTVLVLLMKLSYRESAAKYSAAQAVLSSELLKLFVCGIQICWSSGLEHLAIMVRSMKSEVNLLFPCLLYVLQNNLLYVAINNLDTTVYVICYQAKILTTAFFSYLLLGTVLEPQQIFALVLLALGISCTQVSKGSSESIAQMNHSLIGLFAVLTASLTSGFAGVYLERIYKESRKSIWDRNFYLSIFSLPISLLSVLYAAERADAMFSGFDSIVWFVVVLQAAGGIVTSFVMRHASALLKCFAVSISICLCMMMSAHAEKQTLASNQVIGALLVNVSIFLYSIKHDFRQPGVELSKQFSKLRKTVRLRDIILFVAGFTACIVGMKIHLTKLQSDGIFNSTIDDIDLENCSKALVPSDLFVPIFVMTRDRISSLQKSLHSYWDTIKSPFEIIILDHFSTFPPMVEYIQQLAATQNNVSVISLVQKAWDAAVVEASQHIQNYLALYPHVSFYVFTDQDVAFPRAAPDVLLFYAGLLTSCPDIKIVGPALQISDIPSHFSGAVNNQTVYEWESRFWRGVPNMVTWNGIGYHVAVQPIDSTFAMFRRDTKFARHIEPSLRTYAPYAAVHVDWYLDSKNLPADKLYYVAHQSGRVNHW